MHGDDQKNKGWTQHHLRGKPKAALEFTGDIVRAAHWQHIRSTNVIESVFATVRLRTEKTKGCGTRLAS